MTCSRPVRSSAGRAAPRMRSCSSRWPCCACGVARSRRSRAVCIAATPTTRASGATSARRGSRPPSGGTSARPRLARRVSGAASARRGSRPPSGRTSARSRPARRASGAASAAS
eukprot:7963825-Lingulodinium_polyedra.AAC.1